jgi:hypothetical protein
MSDLFTHSPFADTTHTQAPQKQGENPLVPPPPETTIEVTIRTMESDLELMAKSGGAAQTAQALQNITLARPERMTFASGEVGGGSPQFMKFVWIGLGILGAVLLFSAGYYLIPYFIPAPEAPTLPITHTAPTQGLPSSTPNQPVYFGHVSLFKVAPDEKFSVSLGAGGKEAYVTQLNALLSSVKSDSRIIEVELKDGANHALSWSRFLQAMGAVSIGDEFWTTRFEDDFTFFFVKQAGKFRPGYALTLKPGTTPLLLKTDVLILENTDDFFSSLYLESPGPASGQFTDFQFPNQAVRMLRFATSTPSLVYGFPLTKYFVISTSDEGYTTAVSKF